jgi:hypothetical protein
METYCLTDKELGIFRSLNTPAKIQDFINRLEYKYGTGSQSPRLVLRTGKANCFEAAVFAAAARRLNGYEPLLIDLRAVRDEDHVLALHKFNNFWGAMGKSKFVGLMYREAIYRSPRELALSYFEFYYNYNHEKTLRGYSLPLNLKIFDKRNWMTTEENIDFIGDHIDEIRHFEILPKGMEKLRTVDEPTFSRGIIERGKGK